MSKIHYKKQIYKNKNKKVCICTSNFGLKLIRTVFVWILYQTLKFVIVIKTGSDKLCKIPVFNHMTLICTVFGKEIIWQNNKSAVFLYFLHTLMRWY